jgi:CO dehydrogenase maturation factor
MLVVVEPGQRSLQVAGRIRELTEDLGLTHIYAVGNKVRSDLHRDFIAENCPVPVIGYISSNTDIIDADLRGLAVYRSAPDAVAEVEAVVAALETEVVEG